VDGPTSVRASLRFVCVHVPALPLQSHACTGAAGPTCSLADTAPLVVVERQARRTLVVARNRLAARAGIETGQTLAEAHALAEPLLVLARDFRREAALLERLASVCAAFTPQVHLAAERASLLLDVSRSLRLHGGGEALCHDLSEALEPMAARIHLVAAATHLAADWLSRAHRHLIAEGAPADWLSTLPLACTDWTPVLIDELAALNLHTVGEVDRLPHAELAARFGTALVQSLDIAHGRSEAALRWWQPATRFSAHVDFLDPAREAAHWFPGVVALTGQFVAFLDSRALAARAIRLTFRNGSRQQSRLEVAAASPTCENEVWLRLIDAALSRAAIGHELSRIELDCDLLEPRRFEPLDLFTRRHEQQRHWSEILALLRLRLGSECVRSPRRQRTPLPESTDTVPSAETKVEFAAVAGARPLLLIDPPRRLGAVERAQILTRIRRALPERIETSAAGDTLSADPSTTLRRDYYIARLANQQTLWIFRDHGAREWFVQGVFA